LSLAWYPVLSFALQR